MVICQKVVDYLTIPAEFHQIGKPQSLQLVGNGRFGHTQQRRQIADTHLIQFQSLENLYAGTIAKHLKKRRDAGKDLSIVVVAEGALSEEESLMDKKSFKKRRGVITPSFGFGKV